MTLLLLAFLLATIPASSQINTEHPVSTPVFIPQSGSSLKDIAIASDGNGFLAAWTYGGDVSVTPLAADGSALTSAAIVFSSATETISGVAVTWSGGAYDVFWSEYDPSTGISPRIALVRIAADGRIVTPRSIIGTIGTVHGYHGAASNGGRVVLATSGGYLRLDEEGNPIDWGPFGSSASAEVFPTGKADLTLINPYASARLDSAGRIAALALRKELTYAPTLACHSEECVAVYKRGFNTNSPFAVARFSPTTSEIGASVDLLIATSSYDLVAAPEGYLLATTTSITRLDDAGHPIATTPLPGSDTWSKVIAASNGRDVLLLLAGKTISSCLVTPSGASQPIVIGRVANPQTGPAIATSGNDYLVAWKEGMSVHAARLSLDGEPLDGGSIVTDHAFYYAELSVAFDLGMYAVAYDTSPDSAEVALIDANSGRVVSRQAICGHHIRLAGNPGILTAAWIDCGGNVVAAGLGLLPVIIAGPPRIPPNGDAFDAHLNAYPALAWNGTAWLITWQDQARYQWGAESFKSSYVTTAIRGARFSQWLTPIDTKPIDIAAADLSASIIHSRVASDGSDFLFAWDLAGGRNEVHARRVSPAGEAIGAGTVAVRGLLLDLAWDGKEFALAFTTDFLHSAAGIAHIRSSGDAVAFEALVIGETHDPQTEVSLVPIGDGRVVAAYTRFAHEALYGGSARVFVGTPHPARGHAAGTEVR
jgi:hypothetical protein